MRFAGVVVVLAGGCGRIAFDPVDDGSVASDDMLAACASYGPWQAPMPVPSIATADEDWEPTLHPDGDLLAFARVGARRELFTAPVVDGVVGTAIVIGAVTSSSNETGPAWSPDGRQLFFSSDRGVGERLFVSDFVDGTFQPPVMVDIAGEDVYAPALAPGGLEIYYNAPVDVQGTYIRRATRTTLTSPWLPSGHETQLAFGTGPTGWVGLSPDGLTIYLEGPIGGGVKGLSMASRATVGDRFGTPTQMAEFAALQASGVSLGDPDLSRDGRRLYMSLEPLGTSNGFDIYVSERSCL